MWWCELRWWQTVSPEKRFLGNKSDSSPRPQIISLFIITNAASAAFRLHAYQWMVDQLLTHLSCNVQERSASRRCSGEPQDRNESPLKVIYYHNNTQKDILDFMITSTIQNASYTHQGLKVRLCQSAPYKDIWLGLFSQSQALSALWRWDWLYSLLLHRGTMVQLFYPETSFQPLQYSRYGLVNILLTICQTYKENKSSHTTTQEGIKPTTMFKSIRWGMWMFGL